MPSSAATWSPRILKRSRSYSDEEFEEELLCDDEEDRNRQRPRLFPPTTPSFVHSPDCHALFAPYWPLDEGGWCGSKAEDAVALLMKIEEIAETYSPPAPVPTTSTLFSSVLLSDAGLHSFRLDSAPKPQTPMDSSNDPLLAPESLPLTSAQKPFKCTICPKSFTRNYDLTRHKSSHQDERAHVCEHCGRSFNRRDALSRHNVVRGCGQNGQIGTRHKPLN